MGQLYVDTSEPSLGPLGTGLQDTLPGGGAASMTQLFLA